MLSRFEIAVREELLHMVTLDRIAVETFGKPLWASHIKMLKDIIKQAEDDTPVLRNQSRI